MGTVMPVLTGAAGVVRTCPLSPSCPPSLRVRGLGRDEATGVRVGIEWGDGEKRKSRSGSFSLLQERLGCLGTGCAGQINPTLNPRRSLLICELCNLSSPEKGRRENSSCGTPSGHHNRLIPSENLVEKGERTPVVPKANSPSISLGLSKVTFLFPLLSADILTQPP